jgi:hypothetical protein
MENINEFIVDPLDISFEPLAGSTLINLLRLLAQNKFKISIIGIPRIIYSAAMSLIISPLNVYEKIKYSKRIENTIIEKPPIFIIGHWRSGTTYLHNLLTQNDLFSYPTTFQTVTPAVFLRFEKMIKPIVDSSLPPTRPQDNIALGADLPQEEEYGIGNLSPYSFYNGWCFPKNFNKYYGYVHLDNGVSSKEIQEWKKIYLFYLKKLTLYNKGKQLILKNPSNTSRIKLLLELFPNAKFIHIYRNPYYTYLSMERNIKKEMTLYCVQKPRNKMVFQKAMVDMYNRMFEKYFKEKRLIPKNNLCEIRYEDLVNKPYETINSIYQKLGLSGFKKSEEKLKKYIESQANIKPWSYEINDEKKSEIYNYFKLTIDKWGY